jgi:hypothetical protein
VAAAGKKERGLKGDIKARAPEGRRLSVAASLDGWLFLRNSARGYSEARSVILGREA